jgi:hypothetical protein
MLRFFRRGRRTATLQSERRTAARYSAVENRVRLGWWLDETFQETNGKIHDLNQGGVGIVVELPPPSEVGVWLRLDCPDQSAWLPVEVVFRKELASGCHFLGIRIHDCPYDLFKTLRGMLYSERAGVEAAEFSSRDWR